MDWLLTDWGYGRYIQCPSIVWVARRCHCICMGLEQSVYFNNHLFTANLGGWGILDSPGGFQTLYNINRFFLQGSLTCSYAELYCFLFHNYAPPLPFQHKQLPCLKEVTTVAVSRLISLMNIYLLFVSFSLFMGEKIHFNLLRNCCA